MPTAVGLPSVDENGVFLRDENDQLILDETQYTPDPARVMVVSAEDRTFNVEYEDRVMDLNDG